MMTRLAPLLTASALVFAAGAALAQAPAKASAEPTEVAPLTVEAAPKPKVVERQAYNFVQGYAGDAVNPLVDQITRWHDPVCVQAVGLVADQEAAIQARIADVAKSLGLHVGKADCRANVEIVFTDQPQGLMDVVYKRRENVLGYYHRHDGVRLKVVTHPIQAWYVTATESDGVDIGNNPPTREAIDDPENPSPAGCMDSPHFTHCLRSKLSNVFVVADSKVLEGRDLGLIADYLVMLTLSQPKSLDGCNAYPSVVDLLAKSACPGRDAPDGLTPADAAYLTALYSSDAEGKKWTEQDDIAHRMAKTLITAAASVK